MKFFEWNCPISHRVKNTPVMIPGCLTGWDIFALLCQFYFFEAACFYSLRNGGSIDLKVQEPV